MRLPRLLTVLAATLTATLVAACGADDGGASDASPASPTGGSTSSSGGGGSPAPAPGFTQSDGGGGAPTSTMPRACASDADCPGSHCTFRGEGEFRAGTCDAPVTMPTGSGSSVEGDPCTGGQLDPNRPYDDVIVVSHTTVSMQGHGSQRVKVVGDDNILTTDGSGSCIFDLYGSNTKIFGTASGGGSNVVNVLSGTNNAVDFDNVGGCNAVNFVHGTLTVKIATPGKNGNGVNGELAQNQVYTLP